MGRIPSKLRNAAANPELVVPYAKRRVMLVLALAAASRYALAAHYVSDLLTGGDRLRTRLETDPESRYIELDVLDFRMCVDLLDEGLSRDLLIDGVREPLATARYREELARLEAERGGLTVVDVGANVGYFALQYPALSRADGEVFAIEPLPSNFSLLEANVRANGFEESVHCHRRAIGPESKTVTMQVSTHSNLGTVAETADGSHYVDEVEIAMVSLDEFLRENDVPFESVDVLRMDLQGYESEVIRGASELLRAGDVGLAFLEIHPWAMADGEYDAFVSTLRDAGFELAFAADGRTAVLHDDNPSYSERELDLDSLEDLRDVAFTTEVILRR